MNKKFINIFNYIFFINFFIVFSKENNDLNFIGCNNINEKKDLNFDKQKIKKIEIDVNNYRAWTVNGIKILTNRSRFVSDEYKKRFKANLIVNYENGIKCFFPARVRHSGDEKDHIASYQNNILQSLMLI